MQVGECLLLHCLHCPYTIQVNQHMRVRWLPLSYWVTLPTFISLQLEPSLQGGELKVKVGL